MDVSSILSAVSSLKIAGEIAVGLANSRTMAEVQAKAVELNQKLIAVQHDVFAAQAAQSALIQRVADLEKELACVKAWETQKQRYQLQSPWSGALVYAVKASMKGAEPPHWICTKCYEDGRKSILNPRQNASGWYVFVCPVCQSQIQSPSRSAAQAEYAPG